MWVIIVVVVVVVARDDKENANLFAKTFAQASQVSSLHIAPYRCAKHVKRTNDLKKMLFGLLMAKLRID